MLVKQDDLVNAGKVSMDASNMIDSYYSLHHHYGHQREVSIASWWDAPTDRRARQELELNFILKWRSPFNIVSKDTSSGAIIFSLSLQSNVLYTIFGN
jgi:hypothetical protein